MCYMDDITHGLCVNIHYILYILLEQSFAKQYWPLCITLLLLSTLFYSIS